MSKTTIYIPITICEGCELPERWKENSYLTITVDVLLAGKEKAEAYYDYGLQHWISNGWIITPSHWYKAVEVDSDGLGALVKKSLEEEKIKRMAADECKRGNRMWE